MKGWRKVGRKEGKTEGREECGSPCLGHRHARLCVHVVRLPHLGKHVCVLADARMGSGFLRRVSHSTRLSCCKIEPMNQLGMIPGA